MVPSRRTQVVTNWAPSRYKSAASLWSTSIQPRKSIWCARYIKRGDKDSSSPKVDGADHDLIVVTYSIKHQSIGGWGHGYKYLQNCDRLPGQEEPTRFFLWGQDANHGFLRTFNWCQFLMMRPYLVGIDEQEGAKRPQRADWDADA